TASSVTIDARVTAMIYTGDQQSALLFVHVLSPAHPAESQRPRDSPTAAGPVLGGQATIACALRSDRPKRRTVALRASVSSDEWCKLKRKSFLRKALCS